MKNQTINVKRAEVTIASRHAQDYHSLTELSRKFDGEDALIVQ
jgi:hypothetical protein